jgi:hypothetical protein
MDRAILTVWKVAEPLPTLATVGADIHARDRSDNFAIRSGRVDVDAIGS